MDEIVQSDTVADLKGRDLMVDTVTETLGVPAPV
jgi:hypothetical protein